MDPLVLVVVVGSTREGRVGGRVAGWFTDQLVDRPEWSVDLLDLATVELPSVYPARPGPTIVAMLDRLDRADAVVVVTPEYNHSYPAGLKQALDLVGSELRRKPVGFVSYGGVSGGLRAVEHLRQVVNELHAVAVRESVSFHGAWNGFSAGKPRDLASARQAVEVLLDDLAWWAEALRTARRELADTSS
jgi:NAD(P)H-dependent FMN reductase